MVVLEPAKRRIRPLDRRCCCCKLCWLPVARTPSELRRPSCTVSENTDVDIVDAVESPRFLPALPTPLDEVVVADESLRENIEYPNDESLSFDSINDFSWSSLLSGGARRRLHRIDRNNANMKKNVAIIAQPPFVRWTVSFYFAWFLTRTHTLYHNFGFILQSIPLVASTLYNSIQLIYSVVSSLLRVFVWQFVCVYLISSPLENHQISSHFVCMFVEKVKTLRSTDRN